MAAAYSIHASPAPAQELMLPMTGMPVFGGNRENQLQQLRLIGFTQIAFEVFPGVAVTFHTVERGGLTVNLLLEN